MRSEPHRFPTLTEDRGGSACQPFTVLCCSCWQSALQSQFHYFRSPIFITVILGFAVSRLHVPLEFRFVAPIIEAAKMINGTLAALACLILGMQIKVESFKRLLPVVAISAAAGIRPGCPLSLGGLGTSISGSDCCHAIGGSGTRIRGSLQMRW